MNHLLESLRSMPTSEKITPRFDLVEKEKLEEVFATVAQVGVVSTEDLMAMAKELSPHLPNTQTNYEDYQNGEWRLLALYNSSGDPTDTTVRENETTRPTPILLEMPTVRKVIENFFPQDNIVLARVARFSPGGRLWEHVDYTELNGKPRLRFHIPIVTEPEAVLVTAGHRIHMGAGHLWALNPKGAHGIAHDGYKDRIHIIVDATIDEHLAVTPPKLDVQYIEQLEQLSEGEMQTRIHALARFVTIDNSEKAINSGLNLFYRFKLPAGHTTHRVVAAAFALAGDDKGYREWLEKDALYMQGGLKHD